MAEAEELEKVNRELAEIESQLEVLMERQNDLMEKRDALKAIINLEKEEKATEVAKTDWASSDFGWSNKLKATLKSKFKLETFRPQQLSAINITLSNYDCILIMPTGGGKSLCYQLPALISSGITVVVSPLISLMEDQIMALRQLNISAAMFSADCTREQTNEIMKAMTDADSTLKLLYVTPEKIAKSKRLMSKLEKMHEMNRFARLAIDEVHCCSQWGHDFRPDYKFLGIMKRQFPKVPILGLTATSTVRVTYDVQKMLDITGCTVIKASFNRPNLKYEVIEKSSSAKESVEELESLIKSRYKGQSGIIYCVSIKDSDEIAKELRSRGIKAGSYHATLDSKSRSKVHRAWLNNEVLVVVATIAFGMGIDKPDVRFVIHYSLSKSMENFYQESGRAGRDDKPADCVLFYRFADFFRQSTMVFTEKTGLTNLYAMVAYAIDHHRCRRSLIAQHFGEVWNQSHCSKMCDHCVQNKDVQKKDITECCLDLYKILDHAGKKETRLTGQKLVDAWLGKGPTNLRVDSVGLPRMSRETCERVVSCLIIEGYLREDFHFTPYSTISYLLPGMKAGLVRAGKNKVEIEIAKGSTKYSTKTPTKSSTKTPTKTSSSSSSTSKSSSSVKPCVVNPESSRFSDIKTAKKFPEESKMTTNKSDDVDFLGSVLQGMNDTRGMPKKKSSSKIPTVYIPAHLDFGESDDGSEISPPKKKIKKEAAVITLD